MAGRRAERAGDTVATVVQCAHLLQSGPVLNWAGPSGESLMFALISYVGLCSAQNELQV